MKTIIAFALLTASSTLAFAADDKPVKPICTGENSPIEVIFDKCTLVKGVSLYGDNMSTLSGIADGMSPSTGGTSAGSN